VAFFFFCNQQGVRPSLSPGAGTPDSQDPVIQGAPLVDNT